jgi:hypothetical protein
MIQSIQKITENYSIDDNQVVLDIAKGILRDYRQDFENLAHR